MKKVLISGAGIAGLSLARLLKNADLPFTLIEKKQQLASDGAGIALPANAVKALRYLGLGKEIDNRAHTVHKIIYTDSAGSTLSEASLLEAPLNADRFVALHRHHLHELLSAGLHEQIHFNTTIDQYQLLPKGILVHFKQPGLAAEEFSAVIGADGINSRVRQLAFPESALSDLGVTIWRWTSKHPIPDLHPTYMLGSRDIFMAYPIGKNEVYCYAQVYDPEHLSYNSSDHQANLRKHFGLHGGLAKLLLKNLPENGSIIAGRLRSMPQALFQKDRIVLVGDAGHACSPLLQQGAAAAMEDVIVLAELLKHFPIEEAFIHYEQFRSERVNWVLTCSDDPLKKLINIDMRVLEELHQRIRDKGPLNVLGWKTLLKTDPLQELPLYLKKHKREIDD